MRDFPVVNIEREGSRESSNPGLKSQPRLKRVVSFKAGIKSNVVPGEASAVVEGIDPEEIRITVMP